MNYRHLMPIVAAGLVVGACGDSTAGFGSGLPAATPLDTLSDAEAQDLCEGVIEAANDAFASIDVCTFFGLLASDGDVAVCNQVVRACRSGDTPIPDNPFELDPPEVQCMDTSAADFEGCDATVAELELCIDEALAQIRAIATAVSCANAAADDIELPDDPFAGAACTALPPGCLDVVGDEMPMPPMPLP